MYSHSILDDMRQLTASQSQHQVQLKSSSRNETSLGSVFLLFLVLFLNSLTYISDLARELEGNFLLSIVAQSEFTQ